MATTFADRLARALEASGKSRADLARVLRSTKGHLGISDSAIGQLLDGTSKSMTAENCARAARFLEVNHYWLATGDGAMRESYAAQSSKPLTAAAPPPPYLTQEELLAQLGTLLLQVPVDMRTTFADTLQAWARSGGEDDRRGALLYLLRAPHSAALGKRANSK